jgi:hypothetical protein
MISRRTMVAVRPENSARHLFVLPTCGRRKRA